MQNWEKGHILVLSPQNVPGRGQVQCGRTFCMLGSTQPLLHEDHMSRQTVVTGENCKDKMVASVRKE